jgi:hypothetical protein
MPLFARLSGKSGRTCAIYLEQYELIGRRGKELVSIPVPEIQLPYFRFGGRPRVSQERRDGTPSEDERRNGGIRGPAGAHILEVELTLEELAQILGESWNYHGFKE